MQGVCVCVCGECVWGVWSVKYIDLICFIYALELFLMERFIEPE